MKKTPFIFSIAAFAVSIPLIVLAAWSPPSQTPPGGNVPGPVWLQTMIPAQVQQGNFRVNGQGTMGTLQVEGNANVAGQATMQSATVNGTGGDLLMNYSPGQDIEMYNGNAINIEGSGITKLNIGSFAKPLASGFTLGVFGDVNVYGFSGQEAPESIKGALKVKTLCLTSDPSPCRTTWPAGGGGGDYVLKTGDNMSGTLTVNINNGTVGAVQGGNGDAVSGIGGKFWGFYGVQALNTVDGGVGVYGWTDKANSRAVAGISTNGQGASFTGGNGYGVDAMGTTYGLYGHTSVADQGVAVFGFNGDIGGKFEGASRGVTAKSTAPGGLAMVAQAMEPGAVAGSFYANSAVPVVTVYNGAFDGWPAINFYNADGLQAYVGFGNSAVGNFPNMAYFGTSGALPLALVTGGAQRLIVNSLGNVGIGIAPTTKLQVQGGGGNAVDLKVNGRIQTGDGTGLGGVFVDEMGTMFMGRNGNQIGLWNNSWVLSADSSGNVTIGTGTTGCLKDADGTVIAGTCASDIKLKKDVKDVDGAQFLKTVLKLRPVTYKWRADEFPDMRLGSDTELGLIAQDAEKADPSLITTGNDGLKAIHFERLPFYLIEAVKEQEKRIDEQREQTEALRKQNLDLLRRIDLLERR